MATLILDSVRDLTLKAYKAIQRNTNWPERPTITAYLHKHAGHIFSPKM